MARNFGQGCSAGDSPAWLRISLVALTALATDPARADDAHYQNFVAGARGAMLGGAFTAIADDSSGLYFNPAGIVDVRRANLSLSTSLYGFERHLANNSKLELGRWFNDLATRPVTGAEINIIPASAGVAVAFGRQLPNGAFPHGLAAGIVVPSYRGSLRQEVVHDEQFDITSLSRISDRTMIFSAGYAYRIGPWLRLGLALHSAVRLVDTSEEFSILDTSTVDVNPVYLSTTSNLSLTNLSTALTLGAKVHPFRNWLFGLAVTTPSLSAFQRGTFGLRSARANFYQPVPDVAPTALETQSSRVRWDGSVLPLWGRLGAAYVRRNDYTLTADLSLYAPTHYELVTDRCLPQIGTEITPICELMQAGDSTEPLPAEVRRRSPIPVQVDRNLVANLNVGAEKLLRGDLSVGFGLYTDLSSAPDYLLDADGNLTVESTRVSNVDHVGATFSVGYFGEYSLSRVGVIGAFGWGQKARPTSPGSRFIDSADLTVRPVDSQEFLIYLFWSSTFRYGEGRGGTTDSENAI